MAAVPNVDSAGMAPSDGEGGLVLPGFMQLRADGVYVDLTRLSSGEELERIVERIYGQGLLMRGLDYARLQRLLYDFGDTFDGLLEIRLASEMVEFPEARRALYRMVKIVDGEAFYTFEPVELESTVDVPIYAINDDDEQVVIGIEQKTISERTELDFDEFVAALWGKGIRFGIDESKVREIIGSGRTERVVVARERLPSEGLDAGIEEQTEALHRDDAPRTLADGRIDLSRFTNRFPQIRQGTFLLMKTPRELGKQGRTLDGKVVEPRLPEDFELSSLAGEGTRIERHGDFDYIVASIDGFLNLDTRTNQLSITEKIINREGVSARTTGNLALEGNEYEEFGEVQEGRTVEGRSLTFHADVFGKVASAGGRVLLEKNLVGGMALNRTGEIIVHGLASSAHLQTASGLIRVKRAENCLLVGDRIEIEWACQCVILAEEVDVGTAEGCAIAGKRIYLGVARERGAEETLVSMLLPDLSGFERLQEDERRYIGECQAMIDQLKQGLRVLTSQPEMQQYLVTAGKLRRREITFSEQQQLDWQQTVARMGPTMKRVAQGREDIQALESEIAGVEERIVQLDRQKVEAGLGIECRLDSVQGEVLVRPLIVPLGSPALPRLQPRELRAKLRGRAPGEVALFASDRGSFVWQHGEPVSSA